MNNKLNILFSLGRPFSPLYSSLMTLRAFLYSKNIFKKHSLPVPVISIGNLTMGGSGKTPVIQWLASYLQEEGLKPAIISRGYRGKAGNKVNIVSDGEKVHLNQYEAGDEPYMLACSLNGIPVITGKTRIHPCLYAVNELNADIILLDDGFQHMAVKRHLDLVLFNATTLAGNSRVFPGGELREPVQALKRCSGFMITGITDDTKKRADKFSRLLSSRFPDKPVFHTYLTGIEIVSADNNRVVSDPTSLDNVFAFCAIANPTRFLETTEQTGISLTGFKTFRDHSRYNRQLLNRLCQTAVNTGATSLLTTEKDFVKIMDQQLSLPLYVLKIRLEPEESFKEFIFNLNPAIGKFSRDARFNGADV
ncbi:tetraacyldisaccharide 4'-kinase [Desulfomarina sp.]